MPVARFNNRFLATAQPDEVGTPSGPANAVQYNDAGAFGGDASFTFDGTNVTTTNVYFADGGVDTSAAGSLDLAQENATSVTVGRALSPVTASVTVPANVASVWQIVDQNGDSYMDVRTTTGGERIQFGSNNVAPNYFFQGTSITLVVGADASGEVEAASFGPGGLTFFNRPMFVGTNVQATAITMGHAAADLTIDSADVVISGAPISMSELAADPAAALNVGRLYPKDVAGITELFYRDSAGNIVQITAGGSLPGSTSVALADNTAGAYTIAEGANPYLTIDTTDGAEQVEWGASAAAANPSHLFQMPDNDGNAFVVRHSGTGAIFCRFETTNGAEQVELGDSAGTAAGPSGVIVYTKSNTAAFQVRNGTTGRVAIALDDAFHNITLGNNADNHTVSIAGDGPLYIGAFANDNCSLQVRQRVGDPAAVGNHGFVYVKDVAGTAELFYEDDGARVVQLTSLGSVTTAVTVQDNEAAAYSVTDTGGDAYFTVTTTTGSEGTVVGNATNNPTFEVTGTGEITLGSAGGRIGVLGAAAVAQTAAYTVTNPADVRAFDTATVTVDELAQVVGTIIADFQLFGYFG